MLMTRHFDYCLSASEGDNQKLVMFVLMSELLGLHDKLFALCIQIFIIPGRLEGQLSQIMYQVNYHS